MMQRTPLQQAEGDLELLETENRNLREILGVALAYCEPQARANIGAMLNKPVMHGGVTTTEREERDEHLWRLWQAVGLLKQVAEHLEADGEGMFRVVEGLPKEWPTTALRLASELQDYVPGKPVMLSARELADRQIKSSPFKRHG